EGASRGGGDSGPGGLVGEDTRIIADTTNNSLLIWSGTAQYDKIINALRRIDIPRRQVLIEATIAEVTLTDELRYGLSWFFKNNNIGNQYQGTGSLNLGIGTELGNAVGQNFSYAISDSTDIVRALLNVLAQDSRVRVLSSPRIMVLDNQDARIQVGDQQPVRTATTVTEGGNTTESIQFKDTGVTLQVTPSINASGQVTLQLVQDVTDVGNIDEATGQRAFLTRQIDSRIAVQSGQTIVLGGLIRERESNGSSGLPGLHEVPIVGGLFGTKSNEFRRTELVILITPQVIANSDQALEVAAEIRERMQGIVPLESPWNRAPRSPDWTGPQ
ncbi:MAG: hypothetical protein R3202_07985, partial [Candidatus Competibacterales bacterium]|nr:hypothetical protein [Candidatus Competibacterales bacterium]